MFSLRAFRALALALPVVASCELASSASVTYTIDPQQSSLALSGFIGTANNSVFGFVELAPGSLSTSYGGTITGNLSGGTLTFSGGSAVTGLENPLPPFNPTTPAGVDNYGAFTFALGPSIAENRLFNIVLDLTGGSATSGSPSTATFAYLNSSQAITPFVNGNNPYTLTGAQSSSSPSLVQIQTVGVIETLTLPVRLSNIVNGTPQPGTLLYTTLEGTIVASRVVPEPGVAGVLALVGALSLRSRSRA